MPFGAVFKNTTGLTKKCDIVLTSKQLENIEKHREDIEIAFQMLFKDKGCKIFPHQQKAARYIVDKLNGDSLINMMAIAPTQSGKTGILVETSRLFIKETNISYKNIYIITGHSSVEWKKQTKERLPDQLKKRVFHRSDLNNIFLNDIKDKKNVLIILDEIQIASAKDQTIHKVFDELGFMNLKTLLENNVKMLEITATPNGSIYELMKWGKEFSEKMVIEAPPEYTSCFKLLDDGRVFEFKDLCDDIIADKKLVKAIDNVKELKETIDTYYNEDPRFHFIRTKTAESQEKTKNNFKQVFGDDVQIIEFDMENKETDVNNIVNEKPDEHTFIFIKEKLRCAKTIENKHIVGVYYERYTSSVPDDDVIIQGMLGRATGYNDNGDSIIFTHKLSITKYRQLLESKFDDRTVNWFSSTTVMKNNKIRGINFFNTPDNIKGFKVVEYDNDTETKEEKRERIEKQKQEREERKQTKALEKAEKEQLKEVKRQEKEAKQKEREAMKKAKEALKEQQKREKEELKEQIKKDKDNKKKAKDDDEEKPKPTKTKKVKDDDEEKPKPTKTKKVKDDDEKEPKQPSENDKNEEDEELKKWKSSFRLKLKKELSTHAKEYEKKHKKEIDQVYLNQCLKTVCNKTFEINFSDICDKMGEPKTWENDAIREFIEKYCNLYNDFPHDSDDEEEEEQEKPIEKSKSKSKSSNEEKEKPKKKEIIEEDIPEVQPKKTKLNVLKKKIISE